MLRKRPKWQERAIRRYFWRPPWLKVAALGVVILLASSVGPPEQSMNLLIAGCAALVIAFALFLAQLARESDKTMDSWLGESMTGLLGHAMEKLDLVDEQIRSREPLIVKGFILSTGLGFQEKDLVWREGRDGVVRFGAYQIAIMLPTDYHLPVYRCDYDFVTNEIVREGTSEFHYQDIVGVSTTESTNASTRKRREKLTRNQAFCLSTSGGYAISVEIDEAKLRSEMKKNVGDDRLPDSGATKAVRVIRAMLRNKKSVDYPAISADR